MRKRLWRWLNDTPIRDQIKRRQAPLLQIWLLAVSIAVGIGIGFSVILLGLEILTSINILSRVGIGLLAAVALAALRYGRFATAVLIATLGFMLPLALFSFNGTVRNSGLLLFSFALPITLVGLLAGRRSLALTTAISIVIVGAAAFAAQATPPSNLGAQQTNPLSTAVAFACLAGLLAIFLDRFGSSLHSALSATLIREQELEQSRAALQRVDAALRESEDRYRLITENSSDLISLIDLAGNRERIYASPSYRTLLGYDPADLLGLSQPDQVHPDDLKNVSEQYQQLVATGSARLTYRMRHTDSSWRWIEMQASTIRQQDHYYGILVGRDVTERKLLEAQLMQSQRLESVGRLAGGVAHDFNNLLTAIMGNTDLARDSLPTGHPAHADLDEIGKSSERAAELTRQLLAFARRQIIAPHVFDLNQLILDMDKLLRRLIGAHIDLIIRTTPDLWLVRADHGQIEQIVVNLAVNARDAMPSGGTLTIETGNVQLDHDYAHRHISVSPGRYVMLAISDTGTGMDEETQTQIFEPFFTTKAPGRGTGLGLATCYGIVKQHGGSIWPYSEPGHGSTFKIYLPQIEAPADHFPLRPNADDPPRGSETVLLAEDEPSVRTLAARVLRAQGYTVVEAENGDAALQLARGWTGAHLDLLLTDVVMPRMSGRTLAGHIQTLFPASAVLFISGYTDNAIVHHNQLDPGIIFLQKPFSPAALARKVREVLDSRVS
ncbi:MAG: PAS domain S-box protein [Chloroflexota bacterium]|nr:PAS domain S-box protein [Chloroflexota bacterium]